MSDSIKYFACFVIGFLLGIILMVGVTTYFYNNDSIELKQSKQWGGAVPMDIYIVYDRDTGVYYAVTEKGGICVMQTMSGETKLVDEGEPPIIHRNQGED